MNGTQRGCVIHLRLSDMRDGNADTFGSRGEALRALAARLGWPVLDEVIENDLDASGQRRKPASAYKTKLVDLPGGRQGYRTVRDKWREKVLARVYDGVNLISEALDREVRNVRDCEDLLEAAQISGASIAFASDQDPDPDMPPVLAVSRGGTDAQRFTLRGKASQAAESSAATSRRVTAGRGRVAALGSYGGGVRPFGFRVDSAGKHYQRSLVQVPAEARAIKAAARELLRGGTLKAIAARWRSDVPSVRGAKWTPSTVRDVLTKPAVAGLVARRVTDPQTGQTAIKLIPALWKPILDRDLWERLNDHLNLETMVITMADGRKVERKRKTTTGNTPRHLASGIGRCGKCGAVVKASGTKGTLSYVCAEHPGHLRRSLASVDRIATAHLLARLERYGEHMLRPLPAVWVDRAGLADERRRLEEQGRKQAMWNAAGDMSDDEFLAGSRARKARLAEIDRLLTRTGGPDPLAEFRKDQRGALTVREVWDVISLERKRDLIRRTYRVTILPIGRGHPRVIPDAASVQMEYIGEEDQEAA